jgi:Sulfotransferase domain
VLPEGKFVFLVRDGRDVVASAMKRWRAGLDLHYTLRKARFVPFGDFPFYAARFACLRLDALRSRERRLPSWGPRFAGIDECVAMRPLAEVCARQWSESVLQAAKSFAPFPTSTYRVVHYEKLAVNTTEELARIAAFCGVPTSAEQVSRIAQEITDCSVDKWRTDGSADAVASIEPLIESTFQRLHRILPQWADTARAAA